VGAVVICALPPLNGFVSEWLVYLGLFRTLGIDGTSSMPAAAIAAVALALIGALAVACFVKLFATVFLGEPRTSAAAHAHDPHASMFAPMTILTLACLGLGILPMVALPLLQRAAGAWADESLPSVATLAPLNWISVMGIAVLALLVVIALIWKALTRSRSIGTAGTWDCGYAQPTNRMQYTGSSLGQTLVGLFTFVTWPRRCEPQVTGAMPGQTRFNSIVPDTVLDRLVTPVFDVAGRYLPMVRVLQQGQTQVYVLYVLVTVLALFLWGVMGI
jgi:hydrogenase-4 component B